jgi:hypothetical protein
MIRKLVNIQPSWRNSDEHMACSLAGLHCKISEFLSPEAIGIGSVEYCRSVYQWPACDPYPDWLPWGREIYRDNVPQKPLFYKPADIPKRFLSSIMASPPAGEWIASEIVEFVSEYRAYIVKGTVLGVYCYSDFETENKPIPFPWIIPSNVTAGIDFGLTKNGDILPVEVNSPYAIGWYGSLAQYQIYVDFIVAGWEAMLEKI